MQAYIFLHIKSLQLIDSLYIYTNMLCSKSVLSIYTDVVKTQVVRLATRYAAFMYEQ